MNSLKLYRNSEVLGIVTNPAQEGPEPVANLELTAAAANHKDLLDYIMSKKEPGQDPPVSLNLFEGWFIEDENGVKKTIFPPAIYPGAKFISWRWRRTEKN
ncbi:MAG: hypothetical protein WC028_02890 [Candidatus Obscuribacterales bacterium]